LLPEKSRITPSSLGEHNLFGMTLRPEVVERIQVLLVSNKCPVRRCGGAPCIGVYDNYFGKFPCCGCPPFLFRVSMPSHGVWPDHRPLVSYLLRVGGTDVVGLVLLICCPTCCYCCCFYFTSVSTLFRRMAAFFVLSSQTWDICIL
jgi:hypothetical protein